MIHEQPSVQRVEHISFFQPVIFDVTPTVKLLWMKEVANDTVRLELFFDAGMIRGKQNIPKIVKSLLLSGTDDQSSVQIHEEIDSYGGYVDIDLGTETAIVTIYCLREHIIPISEQVHKAIQNLSFREDEVTDTLASLAQDFKVNQKKVKSRVSDAFRRHCFSGIPEYAWVSALSDFEQPSMLTYRNFWREHYLNGLTRITLVGNLDQDTVDSLIDLFGQWSKSGTPFFADNFSCEPKRIHIPMEDAVQTAIRIGTFTIPKNHNDRHGLGILNTILGGYFGSRLMTNIREDKGYTYGIGSGVLDYMHGSSLVIMTEVGKDVTEATLEEIHKEITILRNELVSEEELILVKNYMLGQLLRSADGPYAMLDMYNGVDMHGLTLEHYDKAIKDINEMTPKHLQELACKYLIWEDFVIATAG